MHAVLLANSSHLLFWGYGPQGDQSRVWDQATGLYTQPTNQPVAAWPDENIWSGAHAHLNDAAGTILVHGGFYFDSAPPKTPNTERRAFLFDPTALTWAQAADLHIGRFYPTTITLSDGTALTLFGEDHANAAGVGCAITGTSATAVQATAPPDGTIAPPGHYLLFLVDRDRTPSAGVWIRLT